MTEKLNFITMRIVFFLLLVSTFFSCNQKHKKTDTQSSETTTFSLQPGDILFQDSDCGPFCEAIEKVTFGINGAKFSHVGMVVKNKKETLVVIEAVSTGVVLTSLDRFLARSFDAENKSKVVVGRLKKKYQYLIPAAIENAKSKLGASYDAVFDITNNKYYCSELIYEAFKFANDGQAIFELQPMTYVDPDTQKIFVIWDNYFKELNIDVPEGEPGLNPGGMSKSNYLEIVHFYGIPSGYVAEKK